MTGPGEGGRAGVRRRQLVEAGLGLLEELPYAEITISLIADRAGLARGLVFYYFDDKDTFFRAVAQVFMQSQRDSFLGNDPATAVDPMAWLEAEVEVFLDLMARHPRIMRTIVTELPEVRASAFPAMADFTGQRILTAFGVPADPFLAEVLRSWGVHSVDLAVRVVEAGVLDRRRLGAVLVAEVRGLLAAAQLRTRPG